MSQCKHFVSLEAFVFRYYNVTCSNGISVVFSSHNVMRKQLFISCFQWFRVVCQMSKMKSSHHMRPISRFDLDNFATQMWNLWTQMWLRIILIGQIIIICGKRILTSKGYERFVSRFTFWHWTFECGLSERISLKIHQKSHWICHYRHTFMQTFSDKNHTPAQWAFLPKKYFIGCSWQETEIS